MLAILALTGGGIMARFTTQVLEHLQTQRAMTTGRGNPWTPIDQCFDMMAGTSAGALCVAGLAMGRSPAELSALFDEHGPKIFPEERWRKLRWLVCAKYKAHPLHAAVEAALDGRNPRLGEVPGVLVFPSIDENEGRPVIFSNAIAEHQELLLRDVVLASSAAPSYFPAHRIPSLGRRFVDGGLFANAPDLAALAVSRKCWPDLQIKDTQIVSIGTTNASPRSPYEDHHPGAQGLWSWIAKPPGRLLKTAMRCQVDHAMDLLPDLGLHSFVRIDAFLEGGKDGPIELDSASAPSRTALARAGTEAYENLGKSEKNALRAILGRRKYN